MIFVEIDIPDCPQEKTEEEHDKRRQEEHKTRSQNPATERGHRFRPQISGAQPISVASFLFL